MKRSLAFIVMILISCISWGAPVYSPSLKRDDLMSVVFSEGKPSERKDGSNDSNRSEFYTLMLPEEPEPDSSRTSKNSEGQVKTVSTEVQITPLHVVRLDESHAVLITNITNPLTCGHGCSQFIGTYFFSHENKGWHLTHRTGTAEIRVKIGH